MTSLAQLVPLPASYKRRVWLAVTALVGFMLLYFVLAGWFLYTAYRVLIVADAFTFAGLVVGVGALFLAVFMLKPLFFVKRGTLDHMLELTAREQPRLFAFLHALADGAEAPRPHRVFLSGEVNAAVFYDLSLVNLLFPSKKNLQIGLPLVNALTFGECRAVLAHEFGHFTQASMAVLRWSQIAHQIAGNVVARRDKLDELLEGLSRIDLRVAWVGWILSLVVWSIRSLVDSVFHGVVLLQRALSREMEFQADLVAVSLTGSDALIHGLYRLQAADDSWDRTLRFVDGERARNRIPRDLFTIHTHIMQRMADILNNPAYGRVVPVPADRPAEHRVFSPELGAPPRMWHTHPLNHEREENAKRRYLAMPIDDASAWSLFDDTTTLREKVTALMLAVPGKEAVAIGTSMEALNAQFERPFLNSQYRGLYLNRSVVRVAALVDDLVGPAPADWRERLSAGQLYPETLIDEIARLRALEKEAAQLRGIASGVLHAPEGIVRHRGRNLRRKELPQVIEGVEREARSIEERLQASDRLCRSVHMAAATAAGGDWAAYLRGLLSALHYADHTAANLRDLYTAYTHVVHVETATRRVSGAGLQRVLHAANALSDALRRVYGDSTTVKLDSSLLQRMGVTSWAALFEEFKLGAATAQNINSWVGVIHGWVNQALGACDTLHDAALEELLLTEVAMAEHTRASTSPVPAPRPSTVPAEYDLLLPGADRPRLNRLSWWQRFQLADGIVPAVARFAVAGGIVGIVLGFGGVVGTATITVYNGLAIPVVVSAAGQRVTAAPHSSMTLKVDGSETYPVTARTVRGELVDSFAAEVPRSFGNFVYNVAGATPLMEWTAVYGPVQAGPPRALGAPRWRKTTAEVLFTSPPQSITTSGQGGTREVLSAMSDLSPPQQLGVVQVDSEQHRMLLAHARWDATSSENVIAWLSVAEARLPEYHAVLAARLAEQPNDVVLLRLEQDRAKGAERDAMCGRHRKRALAAPDDPDLAYLAARCLTDSDARMAAFMAAYGRWPKNGWLAMGVGYAYTGTGRWRESLAPLDQARRTVRPLSDWLAVDLARIHRMLDHDSAAVFALIGASKRLESLLNLEHGIGFDSTPLLAYEALARGDIASAVSRARGDSEPAARVLRLAAASDGASAALIDRALALGAKAGVDTYSRWVTIGLAVRERRDYEDLLQGDEGMPAEYTDHLSRFVDLLRRGSSVAAAEAELRELPLSMRGLAYSVAVIAKGRNAPQAWRRGAKRLLFAWERPYFR